MIDRLPRLAVIQAEGAAPFYRFVQHGAQYFKPIPNPETLATALRIGDPVSWPKALNEIRATDGLVEMVTEQEIAYAKAVIGRAGIGCEPASAATLAGIRELTARQMIARDPDQLASMLS